jgi:vacuolar protein sorting-associated protein 16
MHLLALRISTFLSMKVDVVLKHWASAKILRSRPTTAGTGKDAELGGDEEVCRMIVEKFKDLGGTDVSYAEIARRAWEVGRTGLATRVCFTPYHRRHDDSECLRSYSTTSQKRLTKCPYCFQ